MSTETSTRPTRDHASLVSYAQIGVYGWVLYAFGPSVPLMRDDEHTTNALASLHGTLFAIGGIFVALSGPRLAIRFGRGQCLRMGSAFTALGLVVYCSGLPLQVTYLGAFLLGIGLGFVIVFANAHINAHQGTAAPSALAEANTFGAVSGMIAPIALGIGVAIGWGWRPGMLVAAVAAIILEFARGSLTSFNDGEESDYKIPERTPLPRRYWLACATLALLVGVEFCLVLWSSELLRARTGMGAGAAALSVTAVVAGMAIGRATGSVATRRFNPEKLLVFVILLALVGFLLAWSGSNTAVVLAMLVVTGCGVGMHWPLGIARAVRASGNHADVAVAYACALTGTSAAIAPFVLAWASDSFGITTAFAVIPLLLIGALILVRVNGVPFDASSAAPTDAH
ncbi:MAG: MFS transporter [Actinomycetes bacterium]